MVEIRYGEHYEVADLAGKSVAEVRELYKSELDLPDKAQASLNGKGIGKKHEPETELNENDELSFEEKTRKGLVLLGAFVLTLAITGGLFAYAYLTDSTTIGATAVQADFASVTANATGIPNYTFIGSTRGSIEPGTLFNITRTSEYTGDLEVNVYLANIDELQKDYSFWMLRLELKDSGDTQMNIGSEIKILSLDSPLVSFACDNVTLVDTFYVNVLGGSYRVRGHGLGTFSADDPSIFCQINQAGP